MTGYTNPRLAPCAGIVLALFIIPHLGPVAADWQIPPSWEAETLSSCDQVGDLGIGLAPFEAARIYERFIIAPEPGARVKGASLRWAFELARGRLLGAEPTLWSAFALDRDCHAISVWVKNPEGHDVGLRLVAVQTDGKRFASPAAPLGAERGWRRIAFPLAELRGANDSRGWGFPFARIGLAITGATEGKAATIYLDELAAHAPIAPEVSIGSVEAPAQATAGQTLTVRCRLATSGPAPLARLRLRVQLAGPDGAPATLALVPLQPDVAPERWSSGSPVAASAAVSLPALVRPGTYQFRVEARNCRLSGSAAGTLEVSNAAFVPSSAKVIGLPERPRIEIAGVPLPPVFAAFPQSDTGGLAAAQAAGARLIVLDATCASDPYGLSPDVWLGVGVFDFSSLDERIAAAIEAAPQARFLLRVFIESPAWWDATHRADLAMLSSIDGRPSTQLPPGVAGRKAAVASWGSDLWRQQASGALTRMIRHVRNGPFAAYILGYKLAAGERGDWVSWGCSRGLFSDYSAPCAVAFRRWLRDSYGDLAQLRAAWGEPLNPMTTAEALAETSWMRDWSDAQIPPPVERSRGGRYALCDPGVTRQVIDFQLFQADLTARTIADFASVARQAAGPDALIGAAYGHLLGSFPAPGAIQNSGHLALEKLLAARTLDFLVGPSAPATARPPAAATAVATVLGCGVLWLPTSGLADDVSSGMLAASRGALMLNLSSEVASEAGRLAEALSAAHAAGEVRRETARVAVVVDETSACYLACGTPLAQWLLCEQTRLLDEAGVAYEAITVSDLIANGPRGYRLLIFANALVLSAEQRQWLRAHALSAGRTCLWLYAPGATDGTVINARAMKELTGHTLTSLGRALEARVRMAGGHPAYSPGANGAIEFGPGGALTPLFFSVSPEASMLGTIRGTNWAGMAALRVGDGVSLFCAVPGIPPGVLHDIATEAGR